MVLASDSFKTPLDLSTESKSLKNSLLCLAIKNQYGPVESSIINTVFVIDREKHILCVTIPIFQFVFYEIFFEITSFRYDTVLSKLEETKNKKL